MILPPSVAVIGTREAELLSRVSAASSDIGRGTDELQQAGNTISTQSKYWAKTAQLKISIKLQKDSAILYEASEEDLKNEMVVVIKESTRLRQLFDDIRADVADSRERYGRKYGVIRSIVEDSCVSLGPPFRNLVEKVRANLKNWYINLFSGLYWVSIPCQCCHLWRYNPLFGKHCVRRWRRFY